IHFFGRVSHLLDFPGQFGIAAFEMSRKRRKRGGKVTFVDWPTVKSPKPHRLGASSYQQPDRHHDKPEMKMPTPNGRWHGDDLSVYNFLYCQALSCSRQLASCAPRRPNP